MKSTSQFTEKEDATRACPIQLETLVGQKKLTKKGGTSLHYVYETVAPTNNKFPSANKHVGLFFSTKTFVAAARRKKKSQSSFVSAFRIAFVLSPHHFE